MKLQDFFTRRNILIGSVVLAAALSVAAYLALRRPPRVAMARYIPATALAFIEIDNLTDVVDGLTNTKAWREMSPVLGLSSQLEQLGRAADLISRTGLGPEEAVIAGRAQYAIALTGIEAESGANEEGPYIHLKPRFAFVVETHAAPETAARLVRERAQILAQRIYGGATQEAQDYSGDQVLVFRGPELDRSLVAASSGSVVLLANHDSAIRACLDAINRRTSTLAENAMLNRMRPSVDEDASIFAFVTEAGIERLVEFGPAILASRFTTDPDKISAASGLFSHLSRQAAAAVLYGCRFDSGGVTEKYLTLLRPEVAEALSEPLKSATGNGFESLHLVPRAAQGFTVLSVERAGELPEQVLKQLTPRLDVVAGLALREFVINFRKEMGLDPADSLGDAVGNEITFIKTDNADSMAMLVRANDRARLLPAVARYLSQDGASVSSEQYAGTEVVTSSNQDGRAAAFVGNFLVLGTRDQIAEIIDAQSTGNVIASDERLKEILASRPENASIISYKPEVEDAGEMMLAIARLTRVSDGSRDLLEQDSMREALDHLPPSVSFTGFRNYGIYTETRSAVGSFSLIGSLGGGEANQ